MNQLMENRNSKTQRLAKIDDEMPHHNNHVIIPVENQSPPRPNKVALSKDNLNLKKNQKTTTTTTKRRSLHPKWKLWEEMDEYQREEAMQEVMVYLDKYGKILEKPVRRLKTHSLTGASYLNPEHCDFKRFGDAGGGHKLCNYRPDPEEDCLLVSFGINNDPSFDIEIVETWDNCHGFAADPTVTLQSKLHPKITFHNFAAEMVEENDERKRNKGGKEKWWYVSFPQIMSLLQADKIDILKIDCEGCEHAFARDIIAEDPMFLSKVGQLSIETHLSRAWINTNETFYYFGMMFPLLEEAGFQLDYADIFGGGIPAEIGCFEQFRKTSYPCGHRFSKKRASVPIGWSCQDMLWSRKNSTYV
mmetsp:Transcript_5370/g.8450  ORF Transcript_5370/g.8450 Transcript_5370/m.8450 type:complete len:360 (-) Transcript_5370:74-1153(-)